MAGLSTLTHNMSNLVLNLSLVPNFISGAILLLVELIGPALAERKDGGTPWHAHRIAERHSLFVLIPIGEGRRMADPDLCPSSACPAEHAAGSRTILYQSQRTSAGVQPCRTSRNSPSW